MLRTEQVQARARRKRSERGRRARDRLATDHVFTGSRTLLLCACAGGEDRQCKVGVAMSADYYNFCVRKSLNSARNVVCMGTRL